MLQTWNSLWPPPRLRKRRRFIKIDMKKYLQKIGRKFQNFVFTHRLGRRPLSARIIFFVMAIFDRFYEYSNTGQVNNFDHYVPKFILQRFRIGNSGIKKGKIFKYDSEASTIKEVDINKSAGDYGYDAFKDKTGALSDFVSKRLFAELVELRGAQVIERLDNERNEPELTFLEEIILSSFLAFQITRVPAFYLALEHFILYLHNKQLLKIPDLGDISFLRSQIVKNQSGVTIDNLLSFSTNLNIASARNHIGSISRQIANEIVEKIYRGNLHLLDIPDGSDEKFVLSDNPVILLDLNQRKEIIRYPAWWEIGKKDLWIFMPISPKRCIFYTKSKRKDSSVEKENIDLVQLVNFGQYLNANKSIFSNEKQIIFKHLKMYAAELNRLRTQKT